MQVFVPAGVASVDQAVVGCGDIAGNIGEQRDVELAQATL
jgi:hypothetical protein